MLHCMGAVCVRAGRWPARRVAAGGAEGTEGAGGVGALEASSSASRSRGAFSNSHDVLQLVSNGLHDAAFKN